MKRIVVVALVAIAAVFLMGQTSPPGTIRATDLQILDSNGQMAAELRTAKRPPDATEYPILILFDRGGQGFGTWLATTPNGAELGIGGNAVYIAASANGGSITLNSGSDNAWQAP
jgi:hypothetical protein